MPDAPPVQIQPTRGPREAEPADDVAIAARLRRAGLAATSENIAMVRGPWHGCAVGRMVASIAAGQEHLARLWGAVCHIRRTFVTFDRAVGAPNRHAQCLRILAPVDAMHADAASPALDARGPDERYRDAVAARARLETWLGYTDKPARSACLRHVVDEPDAPLADAAGIVAALECVADGLAGRTPTYRGRDRIDTQGKA